MSVLLCFWQYDHYVLQPGSKTSSFNAIGRLQTSVTTIIFLSCFQNIWHEKLHLYIVCGAVRALLSIIFSVQICLGNVPGSYLLVLHLYPSLVLTLNYWLSSQTIPLDHRPGLRPIPCNVRNGLVPFYIMLLVHLLSHIYAAPKVNIFPDLLTPLRLIVLLVGDFTY